MYQGGFISVMSHNVTQKKIEDYTERYGHIPRDYMERLKWLYKEYPYTKDDLAELLMNVDELTSTCWDSVTYIFYMDPGTSPRPRLNPKTFTFYVSGAADMKRVFDDFKAVHSGLDYVISTPCILRTKTYTKTPSSMNAKEKLAAELELIHNLNSPDWDNAGKLYCDMVQKTLVSNDSIVFRGEVEKFYSVLPRVEVTLHYMTKYDCKYNKRTVENRKSFYDNPLHIENVEYVIG